MKKQKTNKELADVIAENIAILAAAEAGLKASEQIKKEVDEYIKSGKLDKEIDESLKESWWEKLINKLW